MIRSRHETRCRLAAFFLGGGRNESVNGMWTLLSSIDYCAKRRSWPYRSLAVATTAAAAAAAAATAALQLMEQQCASAENS